eukprot:TRINITY_DN14517_c0_g3_i2.p1 TRINITY_DN14517_c0_g3~~TRINITY_DN14517_c0_g3_i2.p1  ORF type:complete len:674 (+),score=92.14 TRINITY_DN14517_c0_g3_i2:74-2023(+)
MAIVIQSNAIDRPLSWRESLSTARPNVALPASQALSHWLAAGLTRASTAPVYSAPRAVIAGHTPTYTTPAPALQTPLYRAATVAAAPQLLRQGSQTVQVAKSASLEDRAAAPCSASTELEASFAHSLREFLKQRGLQRCAPALEEWCWTNGAAFMDEVHQNLDEIAEALQLSAEEKSRLLQVTPVSVPTGPAAAACVSSTATAYPAVALPTRPASMRLGARTTSTLPTARLPSEFPAHRAIVAASSSSRQRLDRTRTNPSTQHERQVASQRVETAYVPLSSWAALASSRNAPPRPSLTPTSTGYVRAGPGMAQSVSVAKKFVVGSAADALVAKVDREDKRSKAWYRRHTLTRKSKKWSRPYSTMPEWIMNARIPTAAELEDPFRAEKKEDMLLKRPQEAKSFEAMRSQFLRQHGQVLKKDLESVFEGPVTLKPAPVSSSVQERFLKGLQSDGELLPGYHGSAAQNYASIYDRGLLIPKPSINNLQVAHGSAHGNGIYTARVGASILSRGFCDEPKILVCGVVSNAVEATGGHYCGRFQVNAESNLVRHVGDAMVVFDEQRVAPLYEASASEFATYNFGRKRTTAAGAGPVQGRLRVERPGATGTARRRAGKGGGKAARAQEVAQGPRDHHSRVRRRRDHAEDSGRRQGR